MVLGFDLRQQRLELLLRHDARIAAVAVFRAAILLPAGRHDRRAVVDRDLPAVAVEAALLKCSDPQSR